MTSDRHASKKVPKKPPPLPTQELARFTRIDEHSRATADDFDREHMGIAAKE